MGLGCRRFCLGFIIMFSIIASPKAHMAGYWSVNCGGFGGSIQIHRINTAEINVNENNLFVSALVKKDLNGVIKIYYDHFIESMNDKIDWNDISKEKPIAEAELKNGILHLSWKGFFDVKKNDYIWQEEADFVIASDGEVNTKMKRCIFD